MSGQGFAGTAALVAGGTGGVGLACCRALLGGGAGLVFCGSDEASVAAAAAELEGLGGGPVAGYVTDVTDAAAVEQLVAETLRLFGRLDVCVAVTESCSVPPPDRRPPRAHGRPLTADVLGVHELLAAVGAVMSGQGTGSIVVIAAAVDPDAPTDETARRAGSAAIRVLARAAARDLAPHGVRVNCVAPGWVDGDGDRGDDVDRDAVRAAVPLGRPARPDEIAAAAAFLAGDEAAAVTGAVLVVDGGLTSR